MLLASTVLQAAPPPPAGGEGAAPGGAVPPGAPEAVLDLVGNDLWIVVGVGVVALVCLVVGVVFRAQVLRAGAGTDEMQRIAAAVQEGASAYLRRQFKTLAIFVVIAAVILFFLPGDLEVRTGRLIFFVVGALFSASIGYLGMSLAVRANVRVAAAAREPGGRAAGARLAIRTGGTVGMITVGLGLLAAAVVVIVYRESAPRVLEGFGFGAALLAMFMRVGGGIFTKAADVGADLVGKVEQGIPEDDPRNAATIADNVGDNVGDCAGMAADLFESYAVTLVAALILGSAAFGAQGLVLPLIIPAIGALTAILGILVVRVREGEPGLAAIYRGFVISAVVAGIASIVAIFVYLPSTWAEVATPSPTDQGYIAMASGQIPVAVQDPRFAVAGAVVVGIVLGIIVLAVTGHYTDTAKKPTRDVAATSRTGAATVVLSGIGLGLESAVGVVVILALGVLSTFFLANGVASLALFLVAMAGTGLLTTVGVVVAMDTFGPVSDNAQGIAEMSGDVDAEGAATLTDLDAVGNTTKAITKGIAIGTAVLAAVALFGSYLGEAQRGVEEAVATLDPQLPPPNFSAATINSFVQYEITQPYVLVGILLGAATVFLFASLTINAVTRAAGAIVVEVRRQFREHPGIMNRTETPEYGRVVDICTRDSLRELAAPGLLAILSPVVVGFGIGTTALAGFLGGVIAAGAVMGVFLANSGGAWDNAKKIVEDGAHGGKGSAAHEATIIGDTVGDPFKDTAGPAINPLIKVINLVAILIVPAIAALTISDSANLTVRYTIAALALLIIVVALVLSKLRTTSYGEEPDDVLAGGDDSDGDPEARDLDAGREDLRDEVVVGPVVETGRDGTGTGPRRDGTGTGRDRVE